MACMTCWCVRQIIRTVSLVSLSLFHVSFAAEIHLSWDANPDPDIAGYKVYARNLTLGARLTFDVGNQTTASFAATEGVAYAFTVTAYNLAGLESAPSTEVRYDAPAEQLLVSWDRSIYSSVAQYRLSY